MTTEADIAAKLDAKAGEVFAERYQQARESILAALERFNPDSKAQAAAMLEQIATRKNPGEAATNEPWALDKVRAELLERLRQRYLGEEA